MKLYTASVQGLNLNEKIGGSEAPLYYFHITLWLWSMDASIMTIKI